MYPFRRASILACLLVLGAGVESCSGRERGGEPAAGTAVVRKASVDPSKELTGSVIYRSDIWNPPNDGDCSFAKIHSRRSMVPHADGSLYFADKRGIRRISPSCEISTVQLVPEPVVLSGFTFDPEGNRYESYTYGGGSAADHNIRKVAPSGEVFLLAGSPCTAKGTVCSEFRSGTLPSGFRTEGLKGLSGLTYANGQILFIERELTANPNPLHLSRLNADGSVVRLASFEGSVRGLQELVVDSKGRIYVSDANRGIVRIEADGTRETIWAGEPGSCLALDAKDRLWHRREDSAGSFQVFVDGEREFHPAFDWPEDWKDPGNRTCGALAFRPDGTLMLLEMGGDGEMFLIEVRNR